LSSIVSPEAAAYRQRILDRALCWYPKDEYKNPDGTVVTKGDRNALRDAKYEQRVAEQAQLLEKRLKPFTTLLNATTENVSKAKEIVLGAQPRKGYVNVSDEQKAIRNSYARMLAENRLRTRSKYIALAGLLSGLCGAAYEGYKAYTK